MEPALFNVFTVNAEVNGLWIVETKIFEFEKTC